MKLTYEISFSGNDNVYQVTYEPKDHFIEEVLILDRNEWLSFDPAGLFISDNHKDPAKASLICLSGALLNEAGRRHAEDTDDYNDQVRS